MLVVVLPRRYPTHSIRALKENLLVGSRGLGRADLPSKSADCRTGIVMKIPFTARNTALVSFGASTESKSAVGSVETRSKTHAIPANPPSRLGTN